MQLADHFHSRSWCKFPVDPALQAWVDHALFHARNTLNDTAQEQWMRYQGTWFAGVNALANDATGRVGSSPPLQGAVIDFLAEQLGLTDIAWDRAQVSICYPGYPKPMQGETIAQHDFRMNRDAAHLDGLHGTGEPKRRHLEETHAFILGIPMVPASMDASPFVIWEGSHEIMRQALAAAFEATHPERWSEIDLTDAYISARRTCFEVCKRVEIHARPGEAYLAHRLSLHGVAPWGDKATAGPDGRMICYFRPELSDRLAWLEMP